MPTTHEWSIWAIVSTGVITIVLCLLTGKYVMDV